MEKKIKCTKCGEIITVSGNPSETITVTCPSCHAVGKITFEKIQMYKSEEPIVQIKNISKKYKDILAARDVIEDALDFDKKLKQVMSHLKDFEKEIDPLKDKEQKKVRDFRA